LADDEEGMLVNKAMLMASLGRGITREELLELMNIVMLKRKDKRNYFLVILKSF